MHPPWNFLYEMAGVNPQKRNQSDIVIKSFFGRVGCCHFVAPKKNVNQSVLTFLKRNAHSVLAKKIINQTVPRKLKNQSVVTLCSQSAKCWFPRKIPNQSVVIFSAQCSFPRKYQNQSVVTWFLKSAHSVLAKKIINQTVDFVGGSVLVSKKTEKPICSDFVVSFVISADFQENVKTHL